MIKYQMQNCLNSLKNNKKLFIKLKKNISTGITAEYKYKKLNKC